MSNVKRVLSILLCLIIFISLSACGGGNLNNLDKGDSYSGIGIASDNISNNYSEEVSESVPNDESKGQESVSENRKLITTVDLDIETQEYDKLVSWTQDKVKELGGYIETSDMYSTTDILKNAYIVIRVPSSKTSEFIESLGSQGNITRKSTKEEDVTLTYVDTESHRNAIEKERDKLLSLLDKAESLDDILAIEDRLANVQWQLESLESTLKTLDSQIDYSTINLSIEEVKSFTEESPEGWWDRASTGFIDTVNSIGVFLSELGIFLIANSPVLLIIGIFAVIIILLVKHGNKRQKERVEEFKKNLPPKE